MGNTTDSQQNTEKTSESKQNTDNTNECKESQPHMGRYDVQWLDDGQILYDYHRYLKCQRQPDSLKPKEHQFGCYLRGCKHTIRVRLTGDGKWVVTQNNMHDSESVHKACQHELHTPNAIHLQNIREIAKQESLLQNQSKRWAIENQMLQNPKLNEVTSVRRLQRQIDVIKHDTLLNFPALPSCPASAAQSVRDHPIWQKNFYGHCEYVLKEKMKELHLDESINLSLNIKDLFEVCYKKKRVMMMRRM
eukprot:508057_1